MYNRACLPVLALILVACSDDLPTTSETSSSEPSSQPTAIVVQSGDGQTEVVARTLANPLVARVTDARGRGVHNARVWFEVVSGGGAIVGKSSMVTDTDGLAYADWRLGISTAAEQAVRAHVMTASGNPTGIDVTFRATSRPDMPWFVEVEASGETIEPTRELTRTVVARAYDSYRNPTPDATVRWSAPTAGTLRADETVTGPDGTTENEWTLRAISGATLGAGAYWITAIITNGSGSSGGPVQYIVMVGDARLVATALAAGASHTCAVDDAGQVHCWGDDAEGQLGDGISDPRLRYAVPISAGGESFTQVVAGRAHTCALTKAGKAFCWGTNREGQLGDGTQAFRSGAVAVEQRATFVSLVAGGEHTCGLTDEGAAFCWGSNRFGQLGDGSLTAHAAPNEIAGGERFTSLIAGVYHTCGLTTDARTVCWGNDEFGQIGTGTAGLCPTRCVTIPIPVEGSFVALSAGMQFTCGIDHQGIAWCWGARLPARTKVESPVPFASLVGSRGSDACGLTDEGRLYCWTFYYDDYYYYYDDPAGLTTPQPVGGGRTFSSFRLGGSQACGIERGDTAWVICWGGLPSAALEARYVLRMGRP